MSEMLAKESLNLIAQAIYNDLVTDFVSQGPLKQYLRLSVSEPHQVYFVCRFPSMIRTEQHNRKLFVIGEDELSCVFTALSGTQPVSIVLFGVQGFAQEQNLQLYHKADNLRQVLLFHECF